MFPHLQIIYASPQAPPAPYVCAFMIGNTHNTLCTGPTALSPRPATCHTDLIIHPTLSSSPTSHSPILASSH